MGLTANTVRDVRSQVLLVSAVCLLSALAWVALWRFGSSPHLQHHPGHQQGFLAPTFFWFFVLGWTVMAVAMMLPSSVPLFLRFHQVSAGRRDRPAAEKDNAPKRRIRLNILQRGLKPADAGSNPVTPGLSGG